MLPSFGLSTERFPTARLRRHPDDVLASVFLKSPCVPSCLPAGDIVVHATVSGLVPGAKYNVLYFVKHGLSLSHIAAKQVSRESRHEPVYAVRLRLDIPPLVAGTFTVGAVVYDAFPGLDDEDAFLTRYVINMDVHADTQKQILSPPA